MNKRNEKSFSNTYDDYYDGTDHLGINVKVKVFWPADASPKSAALTLTSVYRQAIRELDAEVGYNDL